MTQTRRVLFLGLLCTALWCPTACGDDGNTNTAEPPTDAGTVPDTDQPDGDDPPDTIDTPDADEPPPNRVIEPRPDGDFAARNADVLGCLTGALDQTLATGAVVGFMEDGQVVTIDGYGQRSLDSQEPVGPETLFRFGSVLKMMTSAAALSYVDDGTLALHQDIREVRPELDFEQQPDGAMSLHMLMSHQGGMIDELTLNGTLEDQGLEDFLTSADFLDILFHAPPGTFYNYSNPNFYLAGLLIEQASGQFYREAITERVFEPLGMDRTVFRAQDVLDDGDHALGTTTGLLGDQAVAVDAWENTWARPAGLGWTSMDNLLRFGSFLMAGNEDVLSQESWQLMRTGQVNVSGPGQIDQYGYGVIVQRGLFTGTNQFRDVLTLFHDGSTGDFTSLLYTLPETGFAMAAMVNGPSGPVIDCMIPALVREAARYPLTQAPDALQPTPETFEQYVGQWVQTAPLGTLPVFYIGYDGQNLTALVPAWEEQGFDYTRRLRPTSQDNFLLETSNGTLPMTGIRDANGDLTHLRSRIAVSRKATEGSGKARPPTNPQHIQKGWEAIRSKARPIDHLRNLHLPGLHP